MNYPVSTIASIIKARMGRQPEADPSISILLTDSRSLTVPEESLFFAIRTRTNDGHRYIRPLYERGVRCFVAEHMPSEMADATDAILLIVPDVTRAL